MKTLLDNITRQIDDSAKFIHQANEYDDIALRIFAEVYNKAPDLFDEKYFMTAPVDLIEGTAVAARSAFLATEISLMRAQDLRDKHGEKAEDVLIETISEQIIAEFTALINSLAPEKKVCWYVPVEMVRSVSPQTFEPRIGFKTRYGILNLIEKL